MKDISDQWLFCPDRGDDGLNGKWYLPETDRKDWKPIDVKKFWQFQGNPDWINLEGPQVGQMGIGWYYHKLQVPEKWQNKELYLWFKCDEDAKIWINGKLVRDRNEGSAAVRWNTPSLVSLKNYLKPGENEIVVRVFNMAQAGGLWDGVRIIEKK